LALPLVVSADGSFCGAVRCGRASPTGQSRFSVGHAGPHGAARRGADRQHSAYEREQRVHRDHLAGMCRPVANLVVPKDAKAYRIGLWAQAVILSFILLKLELFDILSDMKTVTLRSLRRDADLLDSVAGGEELLVTRFGKPYVRIVPASQSASFVGAGRHFDVKKPVSCDPIPQSEWRGLA
jgi:antitoxin (DNA-binding transcriptional repressor) of toxin-antitoxin stability system